MEKSLKKKRIRVPHTYVILFSVIIIMSLLTYVIPAGNLTELWTQIQIGPL